VLQSLPGILKGREAPPEGGVVLQDGDGQLLQSFN
jgi:hypothetical protein